jgi:hypothetical protein
MSRVTTTALPQPSAIHATLQGADFWDAYAAPDPAPAASALQAWLDLAARTPRWTRRLMALRNRLVRLVGLQDLGQLDGGLPPGAQAARYRVGDRVGIFTIRHLDAREVVMGQDDTHLDVQVSLCKREQDGRPVVVLGTVVHVHNALGHAYMAVVKPFHRRIVRAMLARLPRTAAGHGAR